MPTTSGFAGAPISRVLVIYIVLSAIISSMTDTKYYFNILLTPHIFGSRYGGQYWRLLAWPLLYANSTEVLFAALTLYQLRVVERVWGSRKMASFIVTTAPHTILLPPFLLLLLRPLSSAYFNHLPSGPTSLVFALLAQYHAAIPYTFRYRLSATPGPEDSSDANGSHGGGNRGESHAITLTSKSTSYLLPLQLALSQLPGSLLPALIGWIVGYAWRAEILPTVPGRAWRVPRWVIGEKAGAARAGDVEGLRRRMREEVGMQMGLGTATGSAEEAAFVGSATTHRR